MPTKIFLLTLAEHDKPVGKAFRRPLDPMVLQAKRRLSAMTVR